MGYYSKKEEKKNSKKEKKFKNIYKKNRLDLCSVRLRKKSKKGKEKKIQKRRTERKLKNKINKFVKILGGSMCTLRIDRSS